MRIAVLAPTTYSTPPSAYGGEVETWLVSRQLARSGHEVWLFAAGGSQVPEGGRLFYVRSAYGEIVHRFDFDVWDNWQAELMSCDVIHDWTHSGATLEELWIAAWQKPVLHTYNGVSWLHPRMAKRNATVPSQAARQAAIEGYGSWHGVYGIPPQLQNEYVGKLHDAEVVYWGPDAEFYTPDPSDVVRVGEQELEPGYLLYVGRPHPSKGVDLMLGLAARRPQDRIVLAWRAANDDHRRYEAQFLAIAAQLPNVSCLLLPEVGHHEAKRSLYRNARCFLSPHRYLEAGGLTVLEAMACGTPVIFGRNGSGPEIVAEPAVGELVDAHGPSNQALDQIEAALSRVGSFNRERCRQYVLERFDLEGIAERYLELYSRVMAGEMW